MAVRRALGVFQAFRAMEVLAAREVTILMVANLLHQGPPGPLVRLVCREIEVLRWTAEGKTSSEIGQIMNITERTVNFHVNCVVEKMGACNKTSAAVRAAMLGLIW